MYVLLLNNGILIINMNLLAHLKCLVNKIVSYFSKIKVLYCSKHFLIINKQYDLKINSNDKSETTVQTLLKKVYPSLANKKLCHDYYFPHRLDFATSGLMCIPVHKEACRIISSVFLTRRSRKYYIAIVRGLFSKEIVELNVPIGEDIRERDIQKMCTVDSKYCIKTREARTIFLVLEEGFYDDYPATKLLIGPVTGRRHQIRVHCSFLGHTIVGDYTYSNRKDTKPPRMFLHCFRLILPNPLEMIDVQTPDPFQNVKNWKTLKQINDIDMLAYSKVENLL